MGLSQRLKRLFRARTEAGDMSGASVDMLMSALDNASPAVRRQAVMALGERGEYRAVDTIIAMLDDRDDEVRLAAVIALGKIGDPRAVEPLIRKLKSYDYFYVRKKAAYTLYTFLKQERLDDSLREKILSHWRSWYLT